MTAFYIAEDGNGDLTLWRKTVADREPVALARKFELHPEAWALLTIGLRHITEPAA